MPQYLVHALKNWVQKYGEMGRTRKVACIVHETDAAGCNCWMMVMVEIGQGKYVKNDGLTTTCAFEIKANETVI